MNAYGIILVLALAGWTEATPFFLLATNDPVQQDFLFPLLELREADPNVPKVELLELPVLSAVRGDPTGWNASCGAWRRIGVWADKEGYDCRLEVLSSDLPCEATISLADHTWTLTVPEVTPDWHVVTVRITDIPPPEKHHRPAWRDVAIAFKGVPAANEAPILE